MNNTRPNYDAEIQAICDYVLNYKIESDVAYKTAYHDFLDTIACGLMALQFKACTKLMGPVVPHATLAPGARVPGTNYELDPVQAAFNIGTMIRWLDFNDTWLAAEWGHPSDNLGGILAISDYLSRCHQRHFTMHDILTAMIKAHEIQGVIALENSFNKRGLDHVVLVKVASTAVVAQLLDLSREEICAAISLAWVDGQSLRTYRHAPNTGTRKSWAAGDATSRAVTLALMIQKGEMGYPSALTAKTWGFYDVHFDGKPFTFQRPYGSYVMENVLFKISYPAEFHAQTAVEAACQLHPMVKDRINDIERIDIRSHEAALRIIAKSGHYIIQPIAITACSIWLPLVCSLVIWKRIIMKMILQPILVLIHYEIKCISAKQCNLPKTIMTQISGRLVTPLLLRSKMAAKQKNY